MGDNSKAKSNEPDYKSTNIRTTDPNEWLRLVEENEELIQCEKRGARMHIRNCDVLRKTIPSMSDTGYTDKSLRAVNVCNLCLETLKRLSVRKFIEFFKEQQQNGKD